MLLAMKEREKYSEDEEYDDVYVTESKKLELLYTTNIGFRHSMIQKQMK